MWDSHCRERGTIMKLLQTIAVAFSMFSAIPMAQFQWNKSNMRYAVVAFPLVGLVCAVGVWLWGLLCLWLDLGGVLTGVGLVLVPVMITGGIHMDGFCDTTDALASHAPRERKLEILKDSQSGAFAVIGTVCYFLFFMAVATEITLNNRVFISMGLVFLSSRTLSAFAIGIFPCAKNSGLLHTFQDFSARRTITIILAVQLVVLFGLLIWVGGVMGIAMVVGALVMFMVYFLLSKQIFGGITGDLAGWFLQLCELVMICALVLGQKVVGL